MIQIIEGDCLNLDTVEAHLIYADPPFATGRNFGEFDDRWSSLDQFTEYVVARCRHIWDYLIPGGVMIVHLDPRAAAYVRVKIDQFAKWESEIIWSYSSGGASKSRLASKHDVLNVWRKPGAPAIFNIQREPYSTPNVSGRKGFHPDGRMLTDVWEIPFLSTTAQERNGYPTQKPLALLERIISIYSVEGQRVLDPFAGSGTTGEAAQKLGRSAILVDIAPEAIKLMKERLAQETLRI